MLFGGAIRRPATGTTQCGKHVEQLVALRQGGSQIDLRLCEMLVESCTTDCRRIVARSLAIWRSRSPSSRSNSSRNLGPESDGLVIDLSNPQVQFAAVNIRLAAVGFAGGNHNYRETLSRLASGG